MSSDEEIQLSSIFRIITAATEIKRPASIPIIIINFTLGDDGLSGTFAVPIVSTEPAFVTLVRRSGAISEIYVQMSADS